MVLGGERVAVLAQFRARPRSSAAATYGPAWPSILSISRARVVVASAMHVTARGSAWFCGSLPRQGRLGSVGWTPPACVEHGTQSATRAPALASAAAETRRSAALFLLWLAPFLAWMLVFMVGGPALVGQQVYDRLDVTNLNMEQFGL